jgi:hypothetical protein
MYSVFWMRLLTCWLHIVRRDVPIKNRQETAGFFMQ